MRQIVPLFLIVFSTLLLWRSGWNFFMPTHEKNSNHEFAAGSVALARLNYERATDPLIAKIVIPATDNSVLCSDLNTPLMHISFNSDLGSIKTLVLNKQNDGLLEADLSIFSQDYALALADKDGQIVTGFYESMRHYDAQERSHTIIFKKNIDLNSYIEKKYRFSENEYQVSIEIGYYNLHNQQKMHLIIPQLSTSDQNSAYAKFIYANEQGSLIKEEITAKPHEVIILPQIVGLTDRYTLVSVLPNHATVDRAYKTTCISSENTAKKALLLEINLTGQEGLAGRVEPSIWRFTMYMGPQEWHSLHQANDGLTVLLDYGWLTPFARILKSMLRFFYSVIPNYGVAILLVTLLLHIALMPLTIKAEEGGRKFEAYGKKMEYIQQRYKHDPERLRQEQERMLSEFGTVGIGTTMITFVAQSFMFLSLSRLLNGFVGLYKAPFFGWIQDLSARDPYYSLAIIFFIISSATVIHIKEPRKQFALLGLMLIISVFVSQLSAGLALYIVGNMVMRTIVTASKKWVNA